MEGENGKVHKGSDHLIRLHEKIMESQNGRIKIVERKIDQIPWILCAALFNIVLTIFIIITNLFKVRI